MLNVSDLSQILERLVGPDELLTEEDKMIAIKGLLNEGDFDADSSLSFLEFEHLVDKAECFMP